MTTPEPISEQPDQLPPVVRSASVDRPLHETFAVFTDEIGAWWPLPTHGMFGPAAGGLAFRDGRLVEISTDGTEAIWGEVLVWDPPHRLIMSWHPGRDASDVSPSPEVEVIFTPEGRGTRIVLEHRGWEAFGAEARQRRHSYIGPNAWGGVLDHFADGAETRPDAVDLTGLDHAYDEFFAAARDGGFGPPANPGTQWDAKQTIAHVALNDVAMVAVCQAIVHQRSARFENLTCHDESALDRWITSCGDMNGLIERGQAMGRVVQAALRRLSPDQLATEVHCRLIHEGDLMVDRPVPWQGVAVTTQAEVHLPAHVEQLSNLRTWALR